MFYYPPAIEDIAGIAPLMLLAYSIPLVHYCVITGALNIVIVRLPAGLLLDHLINLAQHHVISAKRVRKMMYH